jgi:hypothetical protein
MEDDQGYRDPSIDTQRLRCMSVNTQGMKCKGRMLVMFQCNDCLCCAAKPPLGLRPRNVVKDERAMEIIEAMKRYASHHKVTPFEWITELESLYVKELPW